MIKFLNNGLSVNLKRDYSDNDGWACPNKPSKEGEMSETHFSWPQRRHKPLWCESPEGHMTLKCRWTLGVESELSQELARKQGPQSYKHKELNSTNNLTGLEKLS